MYLDNNHGIIQNEVLKVQIKVLVLFKKSTGAR